jgi:uncharacterized membrane protein
MRMDAHPASAMSANSTLSPATLRVIRFIDELVLRVTQHWLAIAIVVLFFFQALPWLAPVLMKAGFTTPAEWIYAVYAPTCHQLAYRSFFLIGAQPAYTLAELQQHVANDARGGDIFFWRAFTGDAQLGYKVAYCERDAAMYTTWLLALVIFAMLQRVHPLKPLSLRVFLLVFIPPIALDGLTQLFGWRESDALLRTLTGFWFALGTAWLVLPAVDEALRDLHAQTARQLERVHARTR